MPKILARLKRNAASAAGDGDMLSIHNNRPKTHILSDDTWHRNDSCFSRFQVFLNLKLNLKLLNRFLKALGMKSLKLTVRLLCGYNAEAIRTHFDDVTMRTTNK